jgi:exportin-T
MDIIVRYSAELQIQPDLIPAVLEFFVGPTGIHSSEAQIQLRAWYLFERLIGKLQKGLVSIAEQILATFMDLLQIRVVSTADTSFQRDDESDSDSEHQDVFFDSQLYLFQSAGLLIASTAESNFQAGQALLLSLRNNITDRLGIASSDQSAILYVHHSIMAIGDIAKGFDNAEMLLIERQENGNRLFATVTDTVLKALVRFEDSSSIRDSVSFPHLSRNHLIVFLRHGTPLLA